MQRALVGVLACGGDGDGLRGAVPFSREAEAARQYLQWYQRTVAL